MGRFIQFIFGEFKCTVLEDNKMDSVVVEDFPAFDANEVAMLHYNNWGNSVEETAFDYLLVETKTDIVMIDAARGNGYLLESLAMAGYQPEQVTHLVITHADGDHVNGIAQFPNAKIIMTKLGYEIWTNEVSRKAINKEYFDTFAKFFPVDILKKAVIIRGQFGKEVLPSLKKRIQLVEEDEIFLNHFSMFYTPGHRTDHFCVDIKSSTHQLIVAADLIRYPFQLNNPKFYSRVDSNGNQMPDSIEKLKSRMGKNCKIFGTHIPFPGIIG